MRGLLTVLGAAVAAASLAVPGVAGATTPKQRFNDVPAGFWARADVSWAVSSGWMTPRTTTTFGVGHTVSRLTAARVLAELNAKVSAAHTPVAANPYTQAVTAGWIGAGTGPDQVISQLQFDHGVVRILGLQPTAKALSGLHTSTGWRPALPVGFGVEQMVRAVGARVNAPDGSDQWELWPNDDLLRADLAAEAYQLGHLEPWAVSFAESKTDVLSAIPTWMRLRRKVLGFALRYAGAPYVRGGTPPRL